MDKRYQVFISSTFRDLIEERQAVLKAVLELDHMPAGMELFPACDDSAWQLIKDVIDSSDYYVLIIGGRYGSLGEDGIGYTEKEYDYALLQKKPVIPLLCKDPNALIREKTETDEATWQKLNTFRKKVEDKHTCVYWSSVDELKSKVIVGLTSAVKRHPATGWVRSDLVPSDATLAEILALKRKISELEAELSADRISPPSGTEHLEQGDDKYELDVVFTANDTGGRYDNSNKTYQAEMSISWNEIFSGIAPSLINEATDSMFRNSLKRHLANFAYQYFKDRQALDGKYLLNFNFKQEQLDICIVQLRALGLIKESKRQRSVKDSNTYWTLTTYGDHIMVQLIALHKHDEPDKAQHVSENMPT